MTAACSHGEAEVARVSEAESWCSESDDTKCASLAKLRIAFGSGTTAVMATELSGRAVRAQLERTHQCFAISSASHSRADRGLVTSTQSP